MYMDILKSCFIGFAFFTLLACASNSSQQPESEEQKSNENTVATPVAEAQPAASQMLPTFNILDASGKMVDLKSFAGKKVFVNLWATWCPPCRTEMPSIESLYQDTNKENVQFVMLSLDNDFETAKNYVQEKGLNLPIYYPAGDLPNLFAVNGIPTTFIFNEEGQLIERREGSDNYDTPAYRNLLGAAK